MVDINMAIANNIIEQLRKTGATRSDFAESIGMTEQDVNKILNGSRIVDATELRLISSYFHISADELVSVPANTGNPDPIRSLMEQVHSYAARQALAVADELADMIIFHAKVRENSEAMMQTWEI